MLPELTKDADGVADAVHPEGLADRSGPGANWLPAPDGPIYLVMRLYWPKDAALDGMDARPSARRAAP